MSEAHPVWNTLKSLGEQFLRTQVESQSVTGSEPVLITIPGVLGQLQNALDHGSDPDEPVRLVFLLAAIMACQRGWTMGQISKQAGAAWVQTAGLRKR